MNKTQQPLIEVRKVKKFFPLKRSSIFDRRNLSVKANEDVTLTIYKGETFGLVGESGCGKTTLGRVILQLYPPTSGSALYYGIPLKELNPQYVIHEIKKLPKYQARAIKSFNKTYELDKKIEDLKAKMKVLHEGDDQNSFENAREKIKQDIKDIKQKIIDTKRSVVENLHDIITKIVDKEAELVILEVEKMIRNNEPLEDVAKLIANDKRFVMVLKPYERFLKLHEKGLNDDNAKEQYQRALANLNNTLNRAKEKASNHLLKQRILAIIKMVETGDTDPITYSIIKKLPHSEPKRYKPLFALEKQLKQKQSELSVIGRDLKNEKKLAKLQKKSVEYKKDSSRQLREASKTCGALILEKDIAIISELMLKRELIHREDWALKQEIEALEAKKAKDQNNHTVTELIKEKNDKREVFAKRMKELTDQIESYRGKNILKITERIDDQYVIKLDNYLETGINLSRLTKEEMRNLRRRLQIIFQDPYSSLNPRLTVGQAIEEAIVEHGMFKKGTKELENYVVDIMARCGLDHYMIHRYAHQFSGGQRQRIGIARALALMPEFVVCDESVSALDVSIRSQILNLLSDLKRERNLTYLFISHDLSVIKYISDRIGVMYLGNLIELAESEELYANPLHPYTKALISAIPTTDNDPNKPKRIILEGDIPSNIFPPSGCKFRTRCPIATDLCAKKVPEYREVVKGHYVACHYYEKTKDIA